MRELPKTEKSRKHLQTVLSEGTEEFPAEKPDLRNYIAVGSFVIIGFMNAGMKKILKFCGKTAYSGIMVILMQKP